MIEKYFLIIILISFCCSSFCDDKRSVLVSLFPDLEDKVSDLHGDVAVVSDHLAEALVPFLQVEYLRHDGRGEGEEGSRLPLSAKGF